MSSIRVIKFKDKVEEVDEDELNPEVVGELELVAEDEAEADEDDEEDEEDGEEDGGVTEVLGVVGDG